MNKENLSKSIVLIGPGCVGKSLLSSYLEEKTNYTRICIDNLFYLAKEEYLGKIKPGEKGEQKYKLKRIKGLRKDKAYKGNTVDQEHIDEESRLINIYIEEYKKYRSMFGDLSKFQCVVEDYFNDFFKDLNDDYERIYLSNSIVIKALEIMFKSVNEPLIIDMPAWFGWIIPDQEISTNSILNKRSKLVKNMQDSMKNILSMASTVLLYPGIDYHKTNAMKDSGMNNIVSGNPENYYDCAKISIDINGLFNQPDNICFQKRWWFDSKESLTKEKLKKNYIQQKLWNN